MPKIEQSVGLVTLLVRDYDEALDFFIGKLRFRLLEDTAVPAQQKRWVVVAPPGPVGASILLARATNSQQLACVGNQAGGRVAFFLYTNHLARDYECYKSAGVQFIREPKKEPYGTVAVFRDVCGNPWDLIQPAARSGDY